MNGFTIGAYEFAPSLLGTDRLSTGQIPSWANPTLFALCLPYSGVSSS
jgi:hypothetical protein